MQTSVELSAQQVAALMEISRAENRPLNSLIQDAVDLLIRSRRDQLADHAFGSWAAFPTPDGLKFQDSSRAEW